MTCRPLWMSVLSGKPLRTTMHRWGAESGSAVRRSHTPGPTRLQDAVRKKFEAHGVQNFHRDVPRSLRAQSAGETISRCSASTATVSSHLEVDRLVHHASGASAEIVAELVADLSANPQHLTIVPVDLMGTRAPPSQRSRQGVARSPTYLSLHQPLESTLGPAQQGRGRAKLTLRAVRVGRVPSGSRTRRATEASSGSLYPLDRPRRWFFFRGLISASLDGELGTAAGRS